MAIATTDILGTTTTCGYKGSKPGGVVSGDLSNAAGRVTFTNAGLRRMVSGGFTCSSSATFPGVYDLRGSGGVRLYVTP